MNATQTTTALPAPDYSKNVSDFAKGDLVSVIPGTCYGRGVSGHLPEGQTTFVVKDIYGDSIIIGFSMIVEGNAYETGVLAGPEYLVKVEGAPLDLQRLLQCGPDLVHFA